MKRLVLMFMVSLSMVCGSCGNLKPDEVKTRIIEGERERMPLMLQQLPFIEEITIDSLRLQVEDEPMSGFLYTTWKVGDLTKSIIVPVDNIRKSKEHRGYIEWNTDWETAAKGFLMQSFMP